MKRANVGQGTGIPKDAILLIPEPEFEGGQPTCGVQPGYYTAKQMLDIVEKHKLMASSTRKSFVISSSA